MNLQPNVCANFKCTIPQYLRITLMESQFCVNIWLSVSQDVFLYLHSKGYVDDDKYSCNGIKFVKSTRKNGKAKYFFVSEKLFSYPFIHLDILKYGSEELKSMRRIILCAKSALINKQINNL